ncbi:MAG: hypothetical protein RLZZ127_1902, partial [Planctomycetota bacterium]
WGWTSLDGLVDGLGRSLAALGRLLGLLHRGHLGAAIAVALIAALAWLLWGLA